MKILISGASGFLGKNLVLLLQQKGHDVALLVRGKQIPRRDVVVWDPSSGSIDPQTLEGFEIVLHLAGKNMAVQRWTKSVKDELFQSRCRDTWLLAQALSRLSIPPKIVLTASAVGYYGDRGEEWVDESAGVGRGFAADLCDHWERATEVIQQNGTRVIHTRFGAIIDPSGGMVARLYGPFHLGLGATLGSGRQWMSWIALDDAVKAIHHALFDSQIRGPINVCTDQPVRNAEFAQVFASALHRKARFRIPTPVLKLIFGEMAKEILLASTKAMPRKLLESGFSFGEPNLQRLFQAFAWN